MLPSSTTAISPLVVFCPTISVTFKTTATFPVSLAVNTAVVSDPPETPSNVHSSIVYASDAVIFAVQLISKPSAEQL